MTRTSIVLVIMAVVFGGAFAAETPNEQTQVKVRTEYRGAEAPNHLVFGMLLYSIQNHAVNDRATAVTLVKKRLRLESTAEADAILTRMMKTLDSVEQENRDMRKELLCDPYRDQDKAAIYRKLDMIDDARVAVRQKHYTLFIADLDKDAEGNLQQWLDEEKKGYHYRASDHKDTFERANKNVVIYRDQACAMLELEE